MIRSVRLRGSTRRLVAGASALAAIGALTIGSSPQALAGPRPAGRTAAFQQASKEFGVPESLLEALSYSQTAGTPTSVSTTPMVATAR